jgi:signal transduction histidine kinase
MFAETLALPDPLPETTRREYLDTIVSESERLTRLLNNVLDFSKIERGQKTYQREPTDLSEVVRRTARTLEYPLAQQGFRLRVETEDGPGAVLADEDALEQAVLNLLTNAMKYSGRSREIDLRVRRVNGDAVIEVEDHGIGIPEEYRSRVTEKFYRVPTPENAGIPGTGLGLTLVDHIAAGHGGRLEIVSGVGSGTRAVIRLPLATES